jgi:hypothetical protein
LVLLAIATTLGGPDYRLAKFGLTKPLEDIYRSRIQQLAAI